jgi:L-glyceraldehyde 3-phosphate reductase
LYVQQIQQSTSTNSFIMNYTPSENRYAQMKYRRCGASGLRLPEISVGLWQNFGDEDDMDTNEAIIRYAFDQGITHFDLANNYGPPPGAAEERFGRIQKKLFSGHLRDELIISSKAGYLMWPGPYGEWGSRKYLMASLHQSLRRMQLDYVDIFYSHRPDPDTPLEETMGALADMVKQGKALYVGISNYKAPEAARAIELLRGHGTPCLIHQPRYSMLDRWVEGGLLDVLEKEGVGCIPFSPLAQGLLTHKYLGGVPEQSRAAKSHSSLSRDQITPERIQQLNRLNEIAASREKSLAQMAIAWLLKDPRVTSVLVGVRNVEQLKDNLAALGNTSFSKEEISRIESLLSSVI